MLNQTILLNRLHALLGASLPLWDVQGDVVLDPLTGRIELRRIDGLHVSITESPPSMRDIVRWSITCADGSVRVFSSVLGVLTAVRDELATTQSSGLPLRLGVMGVST